MTEQDRAKADRVTLTGRLGREPHFRTTQNGREVTHLSIGVHRDPDTTVWKHVMAFNTDRRPLAFKALELQKGQEVTIIGYRHYHEVFIQPKGGQRITRYVEAIYAAAIRTGPQSRKQAS